MKVIGNKGLEKIFAIIRDELKNSAESNKDEFASMLSDYFYSKSEVEEIVASGNNGSSGSGGFENGDERTPGFNESMIWKKVDTGIAYDVTSVINAAGKFVAAYRSNYICIINETNPYTGFKTINLSDIIDESTHTITINNLVYLYGKFYVTAMVGDTNTGYIISTEDFEEFSVTIIKDTTSVYAMYTDGNSGYFIANEANSTQPSGSTTYNCLYRYNLSISECSIADASLRSPVNCVKVKELNYFIGRFRSNFRVTDGWFIVTLEGRSTSSRYNYPDTIAISIDGTFKSLSTLTSTPSLYYKNNVSIDGAIYEFSFDYNSSLTKKYKYEIYRFDKASMAWTLVYDSGYNHTKEYAKCLNLNDCIYVNGKFLFILGGKGYFTSSVEELFQEIEDESGFFQISTNNILSITHNYEHVVAGGENGTLIIAKIS